MNKSCKKTTTDNQHSECSIETCLHKYEKNINTCTEEIKVKENISLLHRIDKDTSGILLHSECPKCFKNVQELIRTRKTVKLYFAIVLGVLEDKILINWLKRDRKSGKMVIESSDKNNAKKASSYIYKLNEILINNVKCTKIIVQIVTGRTHQIRVQLAHISRPVLGDKIYGWDKEEYLSASKQNDRLCLHSMTYGINDEVNKINKYFVSPAKF